jgi:hypothetical protein
MSKIEKKKEKLKERIESLEFELNNKLKKKSQGTAINIQEYHSKILALKRELIEVK